MSRALTVPRQPTRRPSSGRVAAALLAFASLAAACNPAPSNAPSVGPSEGPPSAPSSATSTTISAYFFIASAVGNAGLVPLERVVPRLEPAGATERAALEALLAGLNEAELAAVPAMYTLIPEGTRLLALDLGEGVATVDLSAEFEAAGSANAKGRLAQVVYTLTQFPTITSVRLKIAGVPITTFTDAQLPLDPPADRLDYTDALPVIFLDNPAWGGRLGNPAHLAGLANAFEAQFLVRIMDAGGHEIAFASVTASCGTGCWGAFDAPLRYSVTTAGPGRVQAYEVSEVDGSAVNVTDYPVTLSP